MYTVGGFDWGGQQQPWSFLIGAETHLRWILKNRLGSCRVSTGDSKRHSSIIDRLIFKLPWTLVTGHRIDSVPIIQTFDQIEDLCTRILAHPRYRMKNLLSFQGGDNRFRLSILPAIVQAINAAHETVFVSEAHERAGIAHTTDHSHSDPGVDGSTSPPANHPRQ